MRGVIGAGFIKALRGSAPTTATYLRLSKNPETEEQMVELDGICGDGRDLARLNAELNEGRKPRFLIEQAFAFSEDELKLIGDTALAADQAEDRRVPEEAQGRRHETRPRPGDDDDARPLLSPPPRPPQAPRRGRADGEARRLH